MQAFSAPYWWKLTLTELLQASSALFSTDITASRSGSDWLLSASPCLLIGPVWAGGVASGGRPAGGH